MDTSNGRLYPSLDAARLAGVERPVELSGHPDDIQTISQAVADNAERRALTDLQVEAITAHRILRTGQLARQKTKRTAARAARRKNRPSTP